MKLKELMRYSFCCGVLLFFGSCDPYSFTGFNFENSLNEQLTIEMVYSATAPVQGDTTFTIGPNSTIQFAQYEEKNSKPTIGFAEFGDLYSSIIARKANGDRSVVFTNESQWSLKVDKTDADYCLIIEESDFE
ncbi:MAG: hypothetical protein Roseis2KO_08670 [Roseivirga sp.]